MHTTGEEYFGSARGTGVVVLMLWLVGRCFHHQPSPFLAKVLCFAAAATRGMYKDWEFEQGGVLF